MSKSGGPVKRLAEKRKGQIVKAIYGNDKRWAADGYDVDGHRLPYRAKRGEINHVSVHSTETRTERLARELQSARATIVGTHW